MGGVVIDDDGMLHLATVTGDTTNGYAAVLEVGVAPSDAIFEYGFE